MTTLVPVRGADCVRPAEGLVGWWTGDGTAADFTGHNHGVLHGGAQADVPGLVGTAFGFDGTNDYVEVPESTALRPVNFTIEAWVNFSSLDSISDGGAPPGEQYLVFRQNSRRGDFEAFTLKKIRGSGGDVFTFLIASATGELAELDATVPIVTNTWYHVAGVRGADRIWLYVDGQLVAERPVDFPQDYGDYPLLFGTTGQSYWDRKLNGALDEVALYDRPLTSEEIAAIYAAGAFGKCKTLSRVLVQPENQTVAAGSNPLFSAIAQAAEPLTYQWTFNEAVIPGATETNLALTNVRPADSGRYAVIVTGSSVVLTSAPAVLDVQLPPAITAQPQHNAGWLGASVDFTVAVTGGQPIQYRWHHNGVPLSPGTRLTGVATHHLTITDLQVGDAGEYTVTAANAVGEVTSSPAVLTIAGPPFVISQPAHQRVVAGSSVRFTVEAVGTTPMFYQWRFGQTNLSDGGNISGATKPALILGSAGTNDAGEYSVVITNEAGQTTSAVAFLEVEAPLPPGSV
ncbi:MAG TPA: immunoglobulin domain-containing protein, partial [Clostridia bacterium]|nr:immunoglobulin domain-containing protein [Clostridia bacterium]